MTVRSASTSLSLPLLCVALAGCGDAVATTDTPTTSSSSSTTETDPTTGVTPTTSTTTGDETTDGMTGSASESTTTTSTTTTTTTGPDTDTAVSATETTSTNTTDTSTTDTSTTSTSTTSTSTTDSTSTTTGDIEAPETCLTADFPVKVPLCGDGGPACTTLRDETVSANQKFRNDMPAIALDGDCEPVVLYSEAVNGYHGFYAERLGPDMWATTPTPMVVATGSLASDPDADVMFAMVDDGAFGTSLWRHSDGQWAQEGALVGMNHVRAHQLVRDGAGALHVGHVDSDFAVQHEVFDGAWSKEQVVTNAEIHVRLALDAADAPRLTSWSTADATWKLHYFAPPGVAEVVTPLGSNVLERQHHDLALVGPEATPWVLLARKQADQVHHDIVLAHRTGPATWETETLAAENSPADKVCDGPPQEAGITCDFDYRQLFPLALVAGETELRALYLAIRRQGTLVSQCEQNPLPFCDWNTQVEERTSELRVAWPGSQPDEHQVAAVDVFTDRATARLDTAGQIHLALYHLPAGAFDPHVRYLMLGGG
ncbi:hypothetical protein SAMN02745121_03178 [Nannocystis exedens]|uniref:Uncharacterized protein n=1 Tax=Nannocystis exedens TaxID=54 RepID=A0A1I1Y9J0_9BACT|nr:hypothetical protein [Nannocystis exedens]PCC71826.1 hypothetical protein NAEX_04905 [Nannocystis exedens]SFE14793.1 hypothetical protein SAMN02745121_03178 [Nannocystis exedens]